MTARTVMAAGLGLLLAGCAGDGMRDRDAPKPGKITIAVPGAASVDSQKLRYDCEGEAVEAEYINAGDVSLVALALDESFVVASNVLSGSGARYAGGPYIWWVKGDEASLQNLMRDSENESTLCRVQS
ncbi:MliC family protein [Aquibaculum sediminis]|uniref:MliC family protein n=1 Tax=Aquibaculum sediminis TaxID=3231907 RepID=UPI0034537869